MLHQHITSKSNGTPVRIGNDQQTNHVVKLLWSERDLIMTKVQTNGDEYLDFDASLGQGFFTLVFVFEGCAGLHNETLDRCCHLSPGTGGLILHQLMSEVRIIHCTGETKIISLSMSASHVRHLFQNDCPSMLTAQCPLWVNNPLGRPFALSPLLMTVLHQLTETNLHQYVQALFVQAKAYELLSLSLDQFCKVPSKSILSPTDIECLHKARRLLDDNLGSPPSLTVLAREAGINDFKLKKGFKEIFQNTPYRYLREQRMLAAKKSLLQSRKSVTEVANDVGYTNLGHFAAAFRKQFGTTPKDYKKKRGLIA